jgi:hypothetical protein
LRHFRRHGRDFDLRLDPKLWVQSADEPPCLFVRCGVQNLPLVRIKRHGRQYRGGNRKAIRGKIFEKAERQRKGRNGPRRRCPQSFIDARSFVADRLERLGYYWTGAVRSGTRDKVDQLTPSHRRVVAVFGRLVQDGQQTIVETHWLLVSFGRTLLSLYASIYNALRRHGLTAP